MRTRCNSHLLTTLCLFFCARLSQRGAQKMCAVTSNRLFVCFVLEPGPICSSVILGPVCSTVALCCTVALGPACSTVALGPVCSTVGFLVLCSVLLAHSCLACPGGEQGGTTQPSGVSRGVPLSPNLDLGISAEAVIGSCTTPTPTTGPESQRAPLPEPFLLARFRAHSP